MHSSMPYSLDGAMCAEYHMAAGMIWPCSLGCHYLGLHHYACSGYNSVCGCIASGRIISHPIPLPCSLEEDERPKPPCNTQVLYPSLMDTL